MAAKKQKLQLTLLAEDFFEGAALIGIVSPLPPSRFCAVLNRAFGLGLQREPELDLCMRASGSDTEKRYFPVFQERLDTEALEITVYRLKGDCGGTLLPEIPSLDYMWLLRSNTPKLTAKEYAGFLKRLPDVQMAQVISVNRLRYAANLVL